jgi:cytochrome c-type biogenesis protein CcmH/NrfG
MRCEFQSIVDFFGGLQMVEKVGNGSVKKETAILIAIVAVVAGFLAGIVFSKYYSGSGKSVRSSGPTRQQMSSPARELTPQQANSILSLEKEVAANPANVTAWIQLGNVYFDTNNYPQAIRAYEKSMELQPNNPSVLTDLGVMYRRNGQPHQAIDAFDKAIGLNPRLEQAWFNKGIVLRYDLHDKEGAVKAWEELLKINPNATLSNGQRISEAIKTL